VGLRTQDHKSLCTAVTIGATLVVPKCFIHFYPFYAEK